MTGKKKYYGIIILFATALIVLPAEAFAFCPLCAVATGILTGFFRWLGVDDTIIGLWLGAFLTSSSILLANYLAQKKWGIKLHGFTVVSLVYVLTIALLYWDGILTTPYNKIFGVSKIIVGIIIGSAVILIAPYLNKLAKRLNGGKNFISHQKMLLSLSLLFVLSLLSFILIK